MERYPGMCHSAFHTICFGCMSKSISTRDNSDPKTSLVVRSSEFCRSLFGESDIGRGLGGGDDHEVMGPSR